MIDLHTHSIFSDGELIPAELARRAAAAGYRAIAITDHGDASNIDFIIPRMVQACGKLSRGFSIDVIPGIELTHIPPEYIHELAVESRRLGAKIIVVHGETIVEPVAPGTNRAALNAPVDILAHPGLITEPEAKLAAKKGIFLEISARKGHSLTNGHVVRVSRMFNTGLVLNTDSHAPGDLVNAETAWKIASGAGMTGSEIKAMFRNSRTLLRKAKAGKRSS
jgi:histidinol phosphatase-like PHP family hydrolase